MSVKPYIYVDVGCVIPALVLLALFSWLVRR